MLRTWVKVLCPTGFRGDRAFLVCALVADYSFSKCSNLIFITFLHRHDQIIQANSTSLFKIIGRPFRRPWRSDQLGRYWNILVSSPGDRFRLKECSSSSFFFLLSLL